ncbi:hypothetical protein COLO4_04587 [Corchorus olitorius]|uniref:Uncharacterized protein n=1 Tax=Corchorus olitorius TaxID=93759 RepID=A0A1R3KTD4_9ROSI|nr:hypothetical protein COLO4_04587 [Corchorus olitorius]
MSSSVLPTLSPCNVPSSSQPPPSPKSLSATDSFLLHNSSRPPDLNSQTLPQTRPPSRESFELENIYKQSNMRCIVLSAFHVANMEVTKEEWQVVTRKQNRRKKEDQIPKGKVHTDPEPTSLPKNFEANSVSYMDPLGHTNKLSTETTTKQVNSEAQLLTKTQHMPLNTNAQESVIKPSNNSVSPVEIPPIDVSNSSVPVNYHSRSHSQHNPSSDHLSLSDNHAELPQTEQLTCSLQSEPTSDKLQNSPSTHATSENQQIHVTNAAPENSELLRESDPTSPKFPPGFEPNFTFSAAKSDKPDWENS